jgi:hypothetical protein
LNGFARHERQESPGSEYDSPKITKFEARIEESSPTDREDLSLERQIRNVNGLSTINMEPLALSEHSDLFIS